MIPDFIDIGAPWNVLPKGIHQASINEVEKRFSTNAHRQKLFEGLKRSLQSLQIAGCKTVYLDGSFITNKETPGDFDACWSLSGVDLTKLDPTLLNFDNKRDAQKLKYFGELFPSTSKADAKYTFLDYFQVDKYTGKYKGIIQINI